MSQRVLVIEDHGDLRAMTASVLRAAGYDVWEASTGREGIARAAALPDLILLDVQLPDVDGFEVCRRLRRDPATASVPILFFTGVHRALEDRIRGLDEGGDGYLMRPVEPEELVGTVRVLLRQHPSPTAEEGVTSEAAAAAALAQALAAAMTQVRAFSEDERRLLEVFASKAAIAIHNARLDPGAADRSSP
jgi:DNA-binding response OmpR family regulator